MSSRLYVTVTAFVVVCVAVSGLTSEKLAPKPKETPEHDNLIGLLNVSKDTALGAMMEKLKAMNQSEIHRLMNETFGSNFTAREAKQFFGGGFGGGFGGFGGGISPILLALILGRDHDGFGGRGGYAPQAPAMSSGDNLGMLAALTLLGLALISRMPTQG